jgi:hypothetical protein
VSDFAGVEFGYVEVAHFRDHAAVKPAHVTKAQGKRWRCAVVGCGRGPGTVPHHGFPQSMNVGGSGNQMAFQSQKKMWQGLWIDRFREAGLPRPLGSVRVEGLLCFPDRRERDQGNFRYMLEKSIGDALQEGGWLDRDDWSRYEFGNLRRTYQKGVAYTLLRLWPSDEELPDTVPGWDVAPMIGQTSLAVGG